jgi:pimeloyl-ACP methyl ester carboxylesterase
MSESDRAELARSEIAQILRESMFEWAVNGVGGWVDDDLAFVQRWGFDPADISVPVLVRYGMTDVLVPPAHGEWLAANVLAASSRSTTTPVIWAQIRSRKSPRTPVG